jgi:hypothetical protein
MSVRIVEVGRRGLPTPVAAPLARKQGEAVIKHLEFCLEAGYHPETMEARPRKGDGKPLGFDTGKLAHGLRLVSAGSTRTSARFQIKPPPSRHMLDDARPELGGMSFIDRHTIITTEGKAAEAIAEATDEYMKGLR